METVTIILSSFASFLIFIYYCLTKNHGHWSSRGVKTKRPIAFFGNIKDRILLKKSFHQFYSEYYFDFEREPYAGLFEGSRPSLMVRDPDLIRNVLSKDFDHFVDRNKVFNMSPYVDNMMIMLCGTKWKKVRTAVTPTFSTGKIKGMFFMVEDCAEELVNYAKNLIDKNGNNTTGDIDIKELFSKFTLDVIASTAFGVNCNSFKDPKSEFAVQISKFNDIPLATRFLMLSVILLGLPPWLLKILSPFKPMTFFNMETIEFLAQVVKDTTKQRKENNIRRNDFLQLLMDAQLPVDKEDPKLEVDTISEDVAIAQSILFFIAGFETSGTLLTMTCYELAQNLEVQEKARKEIRNKLENGKITYEDLNELPYLDMVMSESLRIHPPVARLDRVCTIPYTLGSVHLEKEDKVFIPVYGLHMDPKYFPEPKLFRPERFSQEEKSKRHMYSYLPFGQGPRNCIGMRFAQMSVKLCLVYIINNFEIAICEKTKIPFEFDTRSMLLKSATGVYLLLKNHE